MKALAFLLAVAPSLAFAAPLKPGDEIDVPRASGQALTLRVTIAPFAYFCIAAGSICGFFCRLCQALSA